MCATQIYIGDTRTNVSVGELATPTMPTGNIGILIYVTNLVLEPSTQDRDTVTSVLGSKSYHYVIKDHKRFSFDEQKTLFSNPFIMLRHFEPNIEARCSYKMFL